jgi:Tol biopolymer transport system component
VSLDAKEVRVRLPVESVATYVLPGFLIYGSQETLFSQPFDSGKLRLTGEAIPIANDVGRIPDPPLVPLASVSQNGVLVYRGGSSPVQLAWHDRAGVRQTSIGKPGIMRDLDLSPDESRVALQRYDTAKGIYEIWMLEISTGILSRLISSESDSARWSPDGRELVFSSMEEGKFDVYRKAIGGSGQTLVFKTDRSAWPSQWLPDGTVLVTALTVYRVPLSVEEKKEILIKMDFESSLPQVSADGRWVAYETDESGHVEVYIAVFPSFNQKRQVSNG